MNRLGAFALLALVCTVVAAPAIAGKGGNGKGSGGTTAPSSSVSPDDTYPALGSQLTFSATYPNGAKNPRIDVRCYQGDTLDYGEAGGSTTCLSSGATPRTGSPSAGLRAAPRVCST
jgi:opacity protein-like surface antigen